MREEKRDRAASDRAARWLLLIHQLPPKPAYLRVKIWRRLQGLGAVSVKGAVYILPAREDTLEDFQWLLREIVEGGGEGAVCEASLVDGLSDQELRAVFDAARVTQILPVSSCGIVFTSLSSASSSRSAAASLFSSSVRRASTVSRPVAPKKSISPSSAKRRLSRAA